MSRRKEEASSSSKNFGHSDELLSIKPKSKKDSNRSDNTSDQDMDDKKNAGTILKGTKDDTVAGGGLNPHDADNKDFCSKMSMPGHVNPPNNNETVPCPSWTIRGFTRANSNQERGVSDNDRLIIDIDADLVSRFGPGGPNDPGSRLYNEMWDILLNENPELKLSTVIRENEYYLAVTRASSPEVLLVPDLLPWLVMRILNGETGLRFRNQPISVFPSRVVTNSSINADAQNAQSSTFSNVDGSNLKIRPESLTLEVEKPYKDPSNESEVDSDLNMLIEAILNKEDEDFNNSEESMPSGSQREKMKDPMIETMMKELFGWPSFVELGVSRSDESKTKGSITVEANQTKFGGSTEEKEDSAINEEAAIVLPEDIFRDRPLDSTVGAAVPSSNIMEVSETKEDCEIDEGESEINEEAANVLPEDIFHDRPFDSTVRAVPSSKIMAVSETKADSEIDEGTANVLPNGVVFRDQPLDSTVTAVPSSNIMEVSETKEDPEIDEGTANVLPEDIFLDQPLDLTVRSVPSSNIMEVSPASETKEDFGIDHGPANVLPNGVVFRDQPLDLTVRAGPSTTIMKVSETEPIKFGNQGKVSESLIPQQMNLGQLVNQVPVVTTSPDLEVSGIGPLENEGNTVVFVSTPFYRPWLNNQEVAGTSNNGEEENTNAVGKVDEILCGKTPLEPRPEPDDEVQYLGFCTLVDEDEGAESILSEEMDPEDIASLDLTDHDLDSSDMEVQHETETPESESTKPLGSLTATSPDEVPNYIGMEVELDISEQVEIVQIDGQAALDSEMGTVDASGVETVRTIENEENDKDDGDEEMSISDDGIVPNTLNRPTLNDHEVVGPSHAVNNVGGVGVARKVRPKSFIDLTLSSSDSESDDDIEFLGYTGNTI